MQKILQNWKGGRAGGDPPCKQVQFGRMFCMLKFRFLDFLYDFIDFHILQRFILGHPFCNLKGWLGII